jgi:tripartite ATP-independent transporter DctP family solute receptor
MSYFRSLTVAAILAMTLPVSGSAETQVLRFTTSQVNPSEPIVLAMSTFAERIKERTAGKVELEVLTGDQLGPQKKVNEMVASGATIMSVTDYGSLSLFAPDVGVIAGPYVFPSVEKAEAFFETDVYKELEAQLEAKGFKVVMPAGLFGLRHVIGNKPVRTPADLEGVTIRVPASPVMVATFSAFGARPTELPWGEVYNALETNVVDAAEAPFGSVVGAKLQETRKVISRTSHQMMFTAWVTSKSAFDAMDPEVQKILLEEGRKIGAELTRMTLDTDEKFAEQLRGEGVEIISDVDLPAFQQAAASAFDAVPGLSEGIVDKVRAAIAQ